MINFFEDNNEVVNCEDLNTLFKMKAKSSGDKTQLSYSDFCKWMGDSISKAGGLYFRHDSNRNTTQINFLEEDKRKRELSGFDEVVRN